MFERLPFIKQLKRGLDRPSKSCKLMIENKSMTPVLCINTASCGRTKSLLSTNMHKMS